MAQGEIKVNSDDELVKTLAYIRAFAVIIIFVILVLTGLKNIIMNEHADRFASYFEAGNIEIDGGNIIPFGERGTAGNSVLLSSIPQGNTVIASTPRLYELTGGTYIIELPEWVQEGVRVVTDHNQPDFVTVEVNRLTMKVTVPRGTVFRVAIWGE